MKMIDELYNNTTSGNAVLTSLPFL